MRVRRPPRIRIAVPQAESIFTRVWLDDVELRGVVRVRFDTRPIDLDDRVAVVTLDLMAEIVFEGDGPEIDVQIVRREAT